ncbi:hypothetical protein [Brevundimonas sp.]|uniref:hypothetical protein n=1 Tax=Brevundimonas sp. TaxID=1871086 RepID=UPI0027300085|nr:hypothetical protein [Brevundimonas sp.]MDP1914261.1 hypothetical protein [Brevundimonas sp.]
MRRGPAPRLAARPWQATLRPWAAAPGPEVLVFAGSRGMRLGEPDTPLRRA